MGCVRADNVTGMLGVDLGSQSVVAKVNAVTDLAGKDVSARRVTTLCLVAESVVAVVLGIFICAVRAHHCA